MKRIIRRLLLAAPLALGIFYCIHSGHAATEAHRSDGILSSSINIQEDATAYSVRVEVPATTDVNVRLAGSTLLLDSGVADNGVRYEQRVLLPQAQADAALGIKRVGGELVISVPKGDPAPAGIALPARMPVNAGFHALRDQVLSQAAQMLQQMNNADAAPLGTGGTQDLIGTFLGSIAPQMPSNGTNARFQLDDRGDAYLLSAALPEDQARNVSVNVDNERSITITSKHEKKSVAGGASAFSSGSSTQSMTLPGPVRGEELKMEYKNGRLEIVLPKK